ncbi:MAG TPA: DNA polymerase III subunit delta, partial [Thiolapillus brandeum]|nr:DNA polymerase III subunit delta [Thiolapillus brandeum]
MLPNSLKSQPRPIYLVASDEPLLLRDWLDAARNLLREQGYEEILQQVVENVQQFDWNGLLEDGQNL